MPGLGVPPAEGLHVPQIAHRRVRAVPVGLGDHEQVGHLEEAGLGRPDAVAHARGDEHGSAALGSLAGSVVAGETDPFRAADQLLDQL